MGEEKVLDHKCPNCGAVLKFNINKQKWACDYCDSEFLLDELKKYENASTEKNNEDVVNTNEVEESNVDNSNMNTYRCDNCGAEIVCDESTSATFCVYCGNTAIIKSRLSNEFKPKEIIPFKKNIDDAKVAFRNLKKGRPFIPKGFISDENINKIKGVYIPFWVYDVLVDGSVDMIGTKIENWISGDVHYTKTSTFDVYREGSMSFTKIPNDGSTHFDDDMMNSIEPFDYKEMVSYNHAYLSGFLAEKYDVSNEDGFMIVSKRAMESATGVMMNDAIGYTTRTMKNNSLVCKENSHEYVLLPVYMINVKFKDKMYLFAMNGQTGRFIGNIPIDVKKVVVWSIIIFIICIIVGLIVDYMMFMRSI